VLQIPNTTLNASSARKYLGGGKKKSATSSDTVGVYLEIAISAAGNLPTTLSVALASFL
jgi:hypothetical protein